MSTGDGFSPADHITEREPGAWRDCTFAAGLEVIRDGFPDGALIPPTIEEKEALRAAAGLPDNHGGATIGQFVTAARRRYHLGGGYFVTGDWGDVRTALLLPGLRLVVQGNMARVPAHLRRWDDFEGGHTVAARGGTTPMWCDPLAPRGTYAGEPVTITTWQSFFLGLPGAQAFITEVGALRRGGNMALLFALGRFRVAATTPFYDAPDGSTIGRFPSAQEVTAVGVPLDRVDDATPGRDFTWRAVLVTSSALDKISGPKVVYVARAALEPVPTKGEWDDFVLAAMQDPRSYTWDDPKPDDTPYGQAQLEAARASGTIEGRKVEHARWEAWVANRPK